MRSIYQSSKNSSAVKDHPSIITSVLTCKCPKCRKGNMFPNNNLFHFRRFYSMNKICQHCGQSFEPEPGFYFGAMFVSYGINMILFFMVWGLLSLLVTDYGLITLIVFLGLTVLLSLPLTFKLSRSIWIAIFVSFRKEAFYKSSPSLTQEES